MEQDINITLQELCDELRFSASMEALLASVDEVLLEQYLLEMENLRSAYSYCEE